MKIIDLSVPIEHRAKSEPIPATIRYSSHAEEAKFLGKPFGASEKDFPDGLGLAAEELQIITHCGTHLDAPWHFGPTSEGKKSKTIDEVPLEWCYGDACVIDVSHKEDKSEIKVEDMETALKKARYKIRSKDIVLIRTGRDKAWGRADYPWTHPGMSAEATLWLLDKGVKVIGTDAYGFDRPFQTMFEEHKKGRKNALWPAHFVGRTREYCHIEKLANLELLPQQGFKFAAFPIKIKNASAGWVRAVAILE